MMHFARLLEAEIPRLRRYARVLTRDLARTDDLVQSCLMRAIAKQHLFKYEINLRSWLFTIMHHLHVGDVRRQVREGTSVELAKFQAVTARPDAFARLELRDVERAIATLPTEHRRVILLVGLQGMAYEDVAAMLNLPVGTVRSRISRGRDALRRLTGNDSRSQQRKLARAA